MANNTEHSHNYVSEKYIVQVQFDDYLSSGKHHTGTKDIQHVLIFCTKCGGFKKLTEGDAENE